MKSAIIPIEEYIELSRLKEDIDKNKIIVNDCYGESYKEYSSINKDGLKEIINDDYKSCKKSNRDLFYANDKYKKEIDKYKEEIDYLKNRNLIQRILNK